MTVTGLPAAADIVLSTLLATETLSSWKVDGNENQTVVVLRFTKGQPFAMDNAQARFRLKPPAQVRRDRKRAQVHRECINGRSTYLSSVPRELPEVNNPSDCTDTTVKDICTPARGELPPVTSDPPPSGRCQIGDKSRSTVPAHRDDRCNTEGQPSQTSADASFVQDIQSMFSEVNRKLEQATAVAKSCVGGSASGRKAEIREDTDVGFLQLVTRRKTDALLRDGLCKFNPLMKHKQTATIAVVAMVTDLVQPVHRESELLERLDCDPVYTRVS